MREIPIDTKVECADGPCGKSLAVIIDREMAKYGVTVNAIAPVARTRLTVDATPATAALMGQPVPEGQFDVFNPANVAPLPTATLARRTPTPKPVNAPNSVPDADQGQNDRQVALQWSLAKMPIHVTPAREKLAKAFSADGDGDRQPDRGPYRVTTTHPVPETKHPGIIDAKRLGLLKIG